MLFEQRRVERRRDVDDESCQHADEGDRLGCARDGGREAFDAAQTESVPSVVGGLLDPSRATGTKRARSRAASHDAREREALGAEEVLLVVDVEPLVALGEERGEPRALAGTGRLDDARPRDLERAVLNEDGRERLVLAGMPGDLEVRLVEQRPHQAVDLVDDPHLPRMLLDPLDRADRVGLGCREQLVEPAPDHVGTTEGVRRAHDREQVVAVLELGQCPRDPLDVGRRRGRVLLRAEERDVGAVPAGDLRDSLAVGRDNDPVEDLRLPRRLDRVGEQRVTREPADVLPRHALRARPCADQRYRARHTASSRSRPRAVVGTPSLMPARMTDPAIASSSVGLPDAALCAADAVRALGHGLDDRPLGGRVEPDPVGGQSRHRARLAKRVNEARAPCLICTERSNCDAARHRRRRENREAGCLLP